MTPIVPAHLDLDALSDSALLDAIQTSAALDIKPATLAVWRTTGRYGLPHTKIGRKVRYRVGDIKAFISRRTFNHTGEVA